LCGGSGTAYYSIARYCIPVISMIHVAQSLVFCVVFCRSLYICLLYFVYVQFRLYIIDKMCQSLAKRWWVYHGTPPINWSPGYNWNIVESGIKHQNPTPIYNRNNKVHIW